MKLRCLGSGSSGNCYILENAISVRSWEWLSAIPTGIMPNMQASMKRPGSRYSDHMSRRWRDRSDHMGNL